MDKFFIIIVALISISIFIILYIRFFGEDSESGNIYNKTDVEVDSANYDNVSKLDHLANLRPDDFELLE